MTRARAGHRLTRALGESAEFSRNASTEKSESTSRYATGPTASRRGVRRGRNGEQPDQRRNGERSMSRKWNRGMFSKGPDPRRGHRPKGAKNRDASEYPYKCQL